MNNLPHRNCPVCSAAERILLYQQRFHTLPEGSPCSGYDVVVCKQCGFAFADHIPNAAAFAAYYERFSRSKSDYSGQDDSPCNKERFVAIADYLCRVIKDKNLRIIDIGCSRGGLLAQLKKRGFTDVSGLDPSHLCARAVQELYNIQVDTGTLVSNNLAQHSFDLVILVGVMEHIPDLDNSMHFLSRLLADNAQVFVEVPDATSFHCVADAPFQEFSIEHINFFSLPSLANLFSRHGFAAQELTQMLRSISSTTVMPSACGIFVKQSDKEPACLRDEQTAPALRKYIEQSAKEEQRLADLLSALSSSRRSINVWGAGTHTLHMLESTDLGKCNIAAYIDSNPELQGKQIQGRPILAPSELACRKESILISSRVYQDEIVHQIKEVLHLPNELILLYLTEGTADIN